MVDAGSEPTYAENTSHCLWEFCVCFCFVMHYFVCVNSSFAIILNERDSWLLCYYLLLLSFRCIVTVNVLWLFVMVPWAGL